ncbi:unnamed protein product [Urochloa humidicola]
MPIAAARWKLSDVNGREYHDMGAGIVITALGHDGTELTATISQQSVTLMPATSNTPGLRRSWALTQLAPPLCGACAGAAGARQPTCGFLLRRLCLLLHSTTEANEVVHQVLPRVPAGRTPRPHRAICRVPGLQQLLPDGRTMGSVAQTSKSQYREPSAPVMPGATFVGYDNLQEAKKLIQSGKLAVVFIEPMYGESGIHSATQEFLQGLREACDEASARAAVMVIASSPLRTKDEAPPSLCLL